MKDGWYFDHIRAVAKRRAEEAKKRGFDKEKRLLVGMGWSESEADMIISLERRQTK